MTANSELNEVVDSDVEEDFVISHPIQDVINRYEERVDEVKEEHDFFRLIKAESMKRQMTLFPSMDLLKHQVWLHFLELRNRIEKNVWVAYQKIDIRILGQILYL